MAGKTPNGKGGWLGGSAVPSWDPGTLTYHMQEQTQQRVDYSYDNNPLNGSYSQNAWGRLTAVQFHDENTGGPFSYMYSYNQAGRVTAHHMDVDSGALGFDAAYTWDDQGRLGGMSGSDLSMTASYGVAGEMLGVNYHGNAQLDSYNETRTYNAMLQMTQVTVAGTTFTPYTQQTVMDMQYVYTGGANNGRITRSIDGVSGETVNYTYDAV